MKSLLDKILTLTVRCSLHAHLFHQKFFQCFNLCSHVNCVHQWTNQAAENWAMNTWVRKKPEIRFTSNHSIFFISHVCSRFGYSILHGVFIYGDLLRETFGSRQGDEMRWRQRTSVLYLSNVNLTSDCTAKKNIYSNIYFCCIRRKNRNMAWVFKFRQNMVIKRCQTIYFAGVRTADHLKRLKLSA